MSSEKKYLDTTVVESLKELLGEKFLVMVDAFVSDGELKLSKIRSALIEQDLSVVASEVHGIKGSSQNIGATELATISAELEQQARANDATGIKQKLSAVEQVFAAVCKELKDI